MAAGPRRDRIDRATAARAWPERVLTRRSWLDVIRDLIRWPGHVGVGDPGEGFGRDVAGGRHTPVSHLFAYAVIFDAQDFIVEQDDIAPNDPDGPPHSPP